ncbi:Asp-tRNA(Asn)/Glu-tRNA(Gln) amidotransferase subunit GatA [Varibaculum vaginae]|uniref:Asp-tRNA(Asn)/Glu-tRNA(Gln) amidotransferase subunit GatA n=1 Tax=Varibaculum vaginae TaxID=2364797 RepID=UPI000F0968D6|nr:Asp-tRNA(Asn)/Glu-tRNA(Gln) amidotransferase subunit GatA [Varibaculum vaginae]
MEDFLKLSALQLAEKLRGGELTSEQLTQACLDRIEQLNPQLNVFVHLDAEGAMETACRVDKARQSGEELHPLAGVPIALKDNMVTHGQETTCASKILAGWKPPYDATVVTKIKQAGLPIIGKTNMDEFAMGSSTEHSAFGPTRNPWDPTRIPGGSGGGSASAVASFMVPLALGSDTGGSIRQPGAVTGTVGAKPTYGAVSRYGLVAMASSLDQIGPVTRTVADAAALQELIGGHDPFDSTSLNEPVPPLLEAVQEYQGKTDLSGLRLGVVKQATGDGYEQDVTRVFNDTVAALQARGATVIEIDMPSFKYALAAYYLIMPAEVSSNLARFDGIRFGIRVEPTSGPVTAETVMAATREAGFGAEVKRRIILGTHVLSAGYFDAYYGSAQKVRTLVQEDYAQAFSQVDALVLPTSPTVAFKLGEKIGDPLTMYNCDIATIPANLAGVPAISVPIGLDHQGLPIGFQVMAPQRADARMYQVAQAAVDACGTDVPAACPVK